MELMEAVTNRRSVRNFTGYYVTDEEIKEMLNAARLAQSWANTQVWEFIVVRDRDLIKKVTETYSRGNRATRCSMSASVLIVACAKMGVSGMKGGEDRTKFSGWFMFDLGVAIQNLCLRAYELGLGTVIVGLMDHDACRQLLAVPEGHEVVVSIPVGKPVTVETGRPRKSLDECVYLNRFGNSLHL
ncbi:MAG: nitroreductase family protein [Thermodesulfobacteriota bacterium]|nr:nitroreductase family protein [Thermodesulfobacteriota bacterium]